MTLHKAWQRDIRDSKALVSHHPPVDLKSAVVRECSRNIAKKIILEYEWLGTLPSAQWYTGIFFDNWECGGVAAFGIGAGVNVPKQFGLTQSDLAYLARGACVYWAPPSTASKLISHSLRIARTRGCKLAIAYADTDAGEIGTVYQASNWLCIGKGSATRQLIHPTTGRAYDQKFPSDVAHRRHTTRSNVLEFLKHNGFIERLTNPKWRYIYILAEGEEAAAIRARIAHLIVPYPKRPKDSSEPPATHAGEGGAAPTRALQNLFPLRGPVSRLVTG